MTASLRTPTTRRRSSFLAVLVLLAAACEGAGGNLNTGPPAGSSPPIPKPGFAFVVIGDFGTGEASEQDVSQAVREWTRGHRVDALITTGDNIYESGDPEDFDQGWREPYAWAEESDLPVIASLGNHDVRTDEGEPVMDLFEMPGRWYTRRIDAAQLFVLDANEPELPAQTAWLRRSLAGSEAPWKIAVFHQPAYSCSKHDGDPNVVEEWVPEFEEGGVDLVLNGHDHNYQRFEETNGVNYVVTGGGGNATLYGLDECSEETPRRVVANDRLHHFLAIEGSDRRLRLRAIAADGTLIDDFSVRADP